MSERRDKKTHLWPTAETEAILQPTPPQKATEVAASGFTLVLLEKGLACDRLVRAIDRIWNEPERPIDSVLQSPCPVVIRSGLTLDAAIVGQFELISCDCVSVFLRDEIVADGSADYLRNLYCELRRSPEFQPVYVTVGFIPDSDAAKHFCDQFLSPPDTKRIPFGSQIAIADRVFFKKGRIMAHWAKEIGITNDIGEVSHKTVAKTALPATCRKRCWLRAKTAVQATKPQ